MEEDKKPEVSSFDADISNLSMVSITMNEMYKELQKAGFDRNEALHLVGVVLSYSPIMELHFSSIKPEEPEEEDFEEDEEYFDDLDDGDLDL